MGYTTDFDGQFNLDKPLTLAHAEYLRKFSETRRMKRNSVLTMHRSDSLREAVNLPVGIEGGYFVGEEGFAGQNHSDDITDYNSPPDGQPGLWCGWEPNEESTAIVWNQVEKFYNYIEWLEYLIRHFLKPWGHVLNGKVTWQGEDMNDRGSISVLNNQISSVEL